MSTAGSTAGGQLTGAVQAKAQQAGVEYDALKDPDLRRFLSAPATQAALLSAGLLTPDGRILNVESPGVKSRLRVIEQELVGEAAEEESLKKEEQTIRVSRHDINVLVLCESLRPIHFQYVGTGACASFTNSAARRREARQDGRNPTGAGCNPRGSEQADKDVNRGGWCSALAVDQRTRRRTYRHDPHWQSNLGCCSTAIGWSCWITLVSDSPRRNIFYRCWRHESNDRYSYHRWQVPMWV